LRKILGVVYLKKIVLFILFSIALWSADSTIEVIKKVNQLTPIVIEDATENPEIQYLSEKFHRVLVNDLKVLTLFDVKENREKTSIQSNSPEFKNREVLYVVKYKLSFDELKRVVGEIKLVHSGLKKELFHKKYTIGQEELYPFLAHKITANLNEHFKMPKIDWLTKYVVFSRYTKPKHSEIVIGDYTLTYMKTVVKNGLNLFPKWADSEQNEFYFTNYNNSVPTLYKMNYKTGEVKKILSSEGMLVCSDVSKDGKKLLLTLAKNGQPDIYLHNLETGEQNALTNYSGIDVSANFIEDENRFTFVSDRLGYPNIFAQHIDDFNGTTTEQLVYYGKNNNSCTSHEKYIVYSSRESHDAFEKNTFNLHLISTDSNFVRRLTATGINQFPKFSPDGGSVLFIKEFQNQSSLGIIRLEYNENFLFPLNIGKIQSIDW
jgi:TolB protein